MKKYEYMVTLIVIKKADEMTKVLSDKFNQYGYDGWELVQYNLIPPSALITASTIPCCGSIYILATFKKRLEKQRMNKEEKCCGNCHWFDNEDIYGVGWCTINSCDVSCDFVCIRHIN